MNHHQSHPTPRAILLIPLILTACGDGVQSPIAILPTQPIEETTPETEYTFAFRVAERTSGKSQPATNVRANLHLDDATIHELFDGNTDNEGIVTFTYQTPNRKHASTAKLEVVAQNKLGAARYTRQLKLRPPLDIELIEGVTQVAPGSRANIVVRAIDTRQNAPPATATIYAALRIGKEQELAIFRGQTDEEGRAAFTAYMPFNLPHDSVELDIVADAEIGQARVTQQLKVVPPVVITPLDLPDGIVAGESIQARLQVYDNVNNEPAAFSDIRLTLSGAGHNSNWHDPTFEGQTDEAGMISFELKPEVSNHNARINVYAHAQAFEGNATFSRSINVKPPLTLALVGTSNQLAPNSESTFQVRVWDNMINQPAEDVAVSVHFSGESIPNQTVFEGCTDADGLVGVAFTVPNAHDAYLNVSVNARSDQ